MKGMEHKKTPEIEKGKFPVAFVGSVTIR